MVKGPGAREVEKRAKRLCAFEGAEVRAKGEALVAEDKLARAWRLLFLTSQTFFEFSSLRMISRATPTSRTSRW